MWIPGTYARDWNTILHVTGGQITGTHRCEWDGCEWDMDICGI